MSAPACAGEALKPEVRATVEHVAQRFRRLREAARRKEAGLRKAGTLEELEECGERFQRSAARARCLYLLEEGRDATLQEAANVALSFEPGRPDAEERPEADLVFTSLPSAVIKTESDPRIDWVESLPAVAADEHYASFETQRLLESREYLHAISEACRQMLGVQQDGPSKGINDFPCIARPRRHNDLRRFVAFSPAGLDAVRREIRGGLVVDRFIGHGSALYHIHIIDLNVFALERPCLPHMSCAMTADELEAIATEMGGRFDRDAGYIEYHSADFVRRASQKGELDEQPMNLADVDSLRHIAPKVEQLASILAEALGVGIFGFDILHSGTDGFHLVGLSLLPSQAFDGAEDVMAVTALHLFEECQQRAVRADIRGAVQDPQQVLGLVVAQHPDWHLVDKDAVELRVLSASTRGDKTGLVVSLTVDGKDPLVCRLRGVIQRTAFEQAIAHEMLDIPNVPLAGNYFGSRVLIGYTESLIRGVQLEKVVHDVDLSRLCRNMGAALGHVHRKVVDVQSPDFLGVPLCVSRMRSNAIIAWEAINRVQSLKSQFDEVFAAVLSYDVERLPKEARAEVFGHFDINLTNVLVDVSAAPEDAPKVSFIDWEQAGPNVAAYDFGKFLVSWAVASEIDRRQLQVMVDDLCEGYAPEWSETSKCGLKQGILAMMPYVAALNFMSNVRHASTEEGDRWVNRGWQHYRVWKQYRGAWVAHPVPRPIDCA